MTDAGRRSPPPLLEWAVTALALLWFLLAPLGVAGVSALVTEEAPDAWALALIGGGVQIGGLLVAAAAGRLLFGRQQLYFTAIVLLVAAGWLLLSGLGRALVPGFGTQLLLGALYLFLLGGVLVSRLLHTALPQAWSRMGLSRSGSLGWGLAAAALVLWPWVLVGSLGDWHESLNFLLRSLASGLLVELLWRGLALGLLLPVTKQRRIAGLVGAFAYVAYEIAALGLGSSDTGIWEVVTVFSVAALSTELWARDGPGKEGIWGAVAFHVLYIAFPRLFMDTRIELEPAHAAVQIYMPVATGLIAMLLLLGRKLFRRRAPEELPPGLAGERDERRASSPRRLLPALVAAVLWTLVLVIYLFVGVPGFANDGYLIILEQQADLSLAADIPDREGRLIFLYTLLTETARGSQTEIRAELDAMGLDHRPYYLVNMIRVDGTLRGMEEMAARPEVAQVMRNPNVRRYAVRWQIPYIAPAEQPAGTPWGVDRVDAELVWEMGITGEGVVVAGQDTGYDWQHPALKDSYRGWDGSAADHDRNWHDAWDDAPEPFDDDKHGTHTLGTAVGNQVGIAPDAQWIGCRNMRRGLGNPGSYVECMEFFFAPYPVGGDPFQDGDPLLAPHVVNNSWGCPPEEGCIGPEPIHTAVEALRAAGIMMVVSAGNDGPACNTVWLPASEDAVFSIGASDKRDAVVYYSSRGPAPGGVIKPEVLAPGVDIRSSIPGELYAGSEGTSMAGPHVAGLVALLWSANPALVGDIEATEEIIVSTANPLDRADAPSEVCGRDPRNTFGAGIVDALSAVDTALEMRPD
jgi:subtilisin family serine protease